MAVDSYGGLPEPNGATIYTPGGNSYMNLCGVNPGDTIIVTNVTFLVPGGDGAGNNVFSDNGGQPGFFASPTGLLPYYLPMLAYRPAYSRFQDSRDQNVQSAKGRAAGNSTTPSQFFVDLKSSLYCRWAGEVKVVGGSSPGFAQGSLLISYYWDRAGNRMATPVTTKGFVAHTLTVPNAPPLFGIAATPTRIPIPPGATAVKSPDANASITLDNGTGTYAQNFTTGIDQWQPVSMFQFAYSTLAPGSSNITLVFRVDL